MELTGAAKVPDQDDVASTIVTTVPRGTMFFDVNTSPVDAVAPAESDAPADAPRGGEDEPVLKLSAGDGGDDVRADAAVDLGEVTVTVVRPPERLDCAEDILAWRDCPQREITYINEQLAIIKKNTEARLAQLDDERIRRSERAQVLLETLRVHGKCLAGVEEARLLARPF